MVLSEQIGHVPRIDAQHDRRLFLDPVGAKQRFKKDLFFEEVQSFPQPSVGRAFTGFLIVRLGEISGQARSKNVLSFFNDDRMLHRILQFPHISRPIMLDQQSEGFGEDSPDLLAHSLTRLMKKVLRQERDVFFPVAQRRQRDTKDIESVIQVLTKYAVGDSFCEVRIGRGNDPDIGQRGHGAANRLELVLLQDPK